MSPRVVNRREDGIPSTAVYVGRPTKWGNPFVLVGHARSTSPHVVYSQEEAVEKYEKWITLGEGRDLIASLDELRGRDLVCWCYPLVCHADVLLDLANADADRLVELFGEETLVCSVYSHVVKVSLWRPKILALPRDDSVPALLRALASDSAGMHEMHLLHEITGEWPSAPAGTHEGGWVKTNVAEARRLWVEWGRERGLIE